MPELPDPTHTGNQSAGTDAAAGATRVERGDDGPRARPTFTVFTPTYNRANTLTRTYGSLQRQTYRDFEWVIVDDGSQDETRELVFEWTKESGFPIRYFYQDHGGKNAALNRGVSEAQGELFLPLDSDDEAMSDALRTFKRYWDDIPDGRKQEFSAVTALATDQDGHVIGDRFPKDVLDSDSLEIFYRYHVTGDKWGFQRVDVMRQFPFPVVGNAVLVPESVVWSGIARRYRTRFVNEPLLRVWANEPGRRDQLTRNLNHKKAAAGQVVFLQGVLNHDIDWFREYPLYFVMQAVRLVRFSLHARIGVLHQYTALRNGPARMLWLLSLPGGIAAYAADRLGATRYLKSGAELAGRRLRRGAGREPRE